MKRATRIHRFSRGFTLVEVLAAMTLAAIVLPVAMRGVSISLSAANHARRQAQAVILAEATLAEVIATGEWQSGEQSGDFGEEAPGFQWRAVSSAWDTESLQCLEVTVSWVSMGVEREVTLATLVRAEGD